jgi:hypothetical protein
MLPKIISIQDLENQVSEKIIYSKLIQQINKDLEMSGIDFKFSENINTQHFFINFQKLLQQIINSNFDSFLTLLYRIDINESNINSIIQTGSSDVFKKIAFEILKREWKKVWYKLNY